MKKLDLNDLSLSASKLYFTLEANCNGENLVEATVDDLIAATNLHHQTILKARKELKDKNVLTMIPTANRGKVLYKIEKPLLSSKFRALFQGFSSSQNRALPFHTDHDVIRSSKMKKHTEKKGRYNSKRQKARKKISISSAEEILLYEAACKIVGVKFFPHSELGGLNRQSLRARINEGYTKEDLLDACRFAAKEWDSGNRWRELKNLRYIWSRGLDALLASKGEYGRRKVSQYREGDDKQQWLDQIQAKIERDQKAREEG